MKEALLPWLWPPEHLLMAWAMSTGVWEEEHQSVLTSRSRVLTEDPFAWVKLNIYLPKII